MIAPAVTLNAVLAVAAPLAVSCKATFVFVVPVAVLLIVAPYVVCDAVAFAPVIVTVNAVFPLLAAAVPLAPIRTRLPLVTAADVTSNPLPVVGSTTSAKVESLIVARVVAPKRNLSV